ncbi:MAG: hypothetical protein K0B37_15855 [Bacteroidales bacterium]|nr:hypothetical protein [Bacteroidales bacterium]
MKNFFNWVIDHDNKILFIILYIGISLVLSIAISLFWLLFAVLLHLGLEVIRQSKVKKGGRAIFLESLWETKVDFALVAFALWLAVYLDFIFGVAGLGAAGRIGVQGASRAGRIGGRLARLTTRFAAWQRVVRSILLSLDDVFNLARIVQKSRRMKNKNKMGTTEEVLTEIPEPTRTSWTMKWSFGDYLGMGLLILFLLLVIFAPFLTHHSYADIKGIILEEFSPFP